MDFEKGPIVFKTCVSFRAQGLFPAPCFWMENNGYTLLCYIIVIFFIHKNIEVDLSKIIQNQLHSFNDSIYHPGWFTLVILGKALIRL